MTIAHALKTAHTEGRALAAFNVPSFDAMLALAQVAADSNQPVILQTSARYVAQEGAATLKELFDLAVQKTRATCYLHLDHCYDHDLIGQCIKAGWDMVMFDGSSMSLEDNINNTRRTVDLARAHNCVVEGEVGAIGGEEDGHDADAFYASDEAISRLASETGIECIAVAFGNVHGDYKSKSNLKWDIFERSYTLAKRPLVLHGGSGLSDTEFQRAITAGAAKINISTDLKKAYADLFTNPDLAAKVLKNPAELHTALRTACSTVAARYINLFANAEQRNVL